VSASWQVVEQFSCHANYYSAWEKLPILFAQKWNYPGGKPCRIGRAIG
jgi:hypothetical protein